MWWSKIDKKLKLRIFFYKYIYILKLLFYKFSPENKLTIL